MREVHDMQLRNLDKRVAEAVASFWKVRRAQADRQRASGESDRGGRSAVTGGAQMDGFVQLVSDLITEAGVDPSHVFRRRAVELPGFFRPTKEWDLLVVKDGQLVIAIEAKSQVGPSFGNNFNNRVEEAIGSALDLWTAYRKGAFNKTISPWLGYVFMLEDCSASQQPVTVREPHFPVFPEFRDASYAKRYELFCRKLVRERHYNASAFVMSKTGDGARRKYIEPADDLAFDLFARSLVAHAGAYAHG